MQQSPIFAKTHDLLVWLIPVTTKFPREHRFVLARRVQETAFDFQESLIEAALTSPRSKPARLADADVLLAKLRSHLRLCLDLGIMTPRQYQHVAEMVTEIGKLLGGWRQSLTDGDQREARSGDRPQQRGSEDRPEAANRSKDRQQQGDRPNVRPQQVGFNWETDPAHLSTA